LPPFFSDDLLDAEVDGPAPDSLTLPAHAAATNTETTIEATRTPTRRRTDISRTIQDFRRSYARNIRLYLLIADGRFPAMSTAKWPRPPSPTR
jgi:hypothetical protein